MNSYVIDSKVIKSDYTLDLINLQFAKSIKELEHFSIRKVLRTFFYGSEIIKKILSMKPDLVYFSIAPKGFAFYRDASYVFLIKLLNRKIVFHLHGKGIKKNIENNYFKKSLYKWVLKNTYVICLSETLSNDIAEVYKGVPFIVNNGIRTQTFRRCEQIAIDKPLLQILYLSNYIKNKGILILVEALGILKTKGYNFNARLVGAPSNVTIKMLEEYIIAQDLAANVKVVGPLHGDDKYLEFQNADIFVFPTYNDAFPLVTLEAMQYGLPVISTYEGSIPEIVINNETGFLVEKQNPQMLADKIAVLLENKELRTAMGKRGYERFTNNFALQHFEYNLHRTFQKIFAES